MTRDASRTPGLAPGVRADADPGTEARIRGNTDPGREPGVKPRVAPADAPRLRSWLARLGPALVLALVVSSCRRP